MIKDHPCYHCPLADCNDTSRHCLLRQALNSYQQTIRAGRKPTAEQREAYSLAKSELYPKARPQEWKHGRAKAA